MPIQGIGTDQFIFNPNGDGNPLNIGKVNSTTAGSQDVPRVALLSDGRFVFVWTSTEDDGGGGGGTIAIRARVYNATAPRKAPTSSSKPLCPTTNSVRP